MFRLSLTRTSSSTQLMAFLFALVLAAAACSGSPEVEAEDASAAIESDDATSDDDGTNTEEDSAESDDVALEGETDAMGEDDAMDEDGVDTTTPAPADDQAVDETTAAGSTVNSAGPADLAGALEAGTSDRFGLPFMYLTVDQDCDGCAETMSLYYVPGEEKASILMLSGAYIDGVAQSDFSAVDPVLQAGDPRRVAEQLTGTDATYGIDRVSGAITSWTLEGNTVTLRCLQVDTRPVDMRTELCENSLIG